MLTYVHNLQEVKQREQEGQLDEGFLSEVSAQLRQVIQSYFLICAFVVSLDAFPFFIT